MLVVGAIVVVGLEAFVDGGRVLVRGEAVGDDDVAADVGDDADAGLARRLGLHETRVMIATRTAAAGRVIFKGRDDAPTPACVANPGRPERTAQGRRRHVAGGEPPHQRPSEENHPAR